MPLDKSTANGAKIIHYDDNGDDAVQWRLEKSNLEENQVPSGASYGVKRYNGQIYMNYTNVINNMLAKNVTEAQKHELMGSGAYIAIVAAGGVVLGPINGLVFGTGAYTAYQASMFYWFFNQVNHGAVWDIKEEKMWDGQLPGIPKVNNFYYEGYGIITPADIGNFMYGYLGSAMRIGPKTLFWGGGVANIKNTLYKNEGNISGYIKSVANSQTQKMPYGDAPEDTEMIDKGIAAWYKAHPDATYVLNIAPDFGSASTFESFSQAFLKLFKENPL